MSAWLSVWLNVCGAEGSDATHIKWFNELPWDGKTICAICRSTDRGGTRPAWILSFGVITVLISKRHSEWGAPHISNIIIISWSNWFRMRMATAWLKVGQKHSLHQYKPHFNAVLGKPAPSVPLWILGLIWLTDQVTVMTVNGQG